MAHFRAATTATDRVAALLALNRSSSPRRLKTLEDVYQEWHGHNSGYANYLRVVPSGTRPDVFEMIEAEKKRASFDITHPTWSRALILPMAINNKMVWTDRGITWVADTVIEFAPINGIMASRLLHAFQHCAKLKPDLQAKVRIALGRIVEEVPEKVSPTVHGQAQSYLAE